MNPLSDPPKYMRLIVGFGEGSHLVMVRMALALHLGISLGNIQVTIWDTREQTQVDHV